MLLAQNPQGRLGHDSRQFTSHSQRNQTAGGSILKRKNTDLSVSRDDTTQPADYIQGQMFSIQEHDKLSSAHSKGFQDNRQSSMNLDPLDESLRDHRIGIQRIENLTDFLMDEYRKRLGIYTQDSKKLIKFWKDYVSVIYKNKRVDTLKKKYASNLQGDFDYEFDKTTPLSKLGMSDLSNNLESGLGPNARTMFGRFKSKKTRALETAKTTFQSNLDQQYELFGNYYEQDVIATIEKDIADKNDSKNQEKLAEKKKQSDKEKDDKNRREQTKIQRSLQVYFWHKQLSDLQAHQKDQENKKLSQLKEEETKKLEEAKNQKKIDQIKISEAKLNKLIEKPRNPNFESGQARLAAPGSKSRSKSTSLKRGNVMPAHKSVRRQPNLGSPTKEQITYKKPEKLIVLEKKYPDQSKKVQESYKKDEEELQKLLFLISSRRQKMTNNIREMTNTFIEAQEDSENKFGRERLEQLFRKYMNPQEQVLRLNLYRCEIQPSKRRAEVTLLDFYISCSDQERALHLFEIENLEKAKEYIANFEKQQEKEKKAVAKEKEEKLKMKEEKYQKQVKKEVFGENFDQNKGELILKNRPDYTKPKDKWKLGKELKALQKMFPHDRVVQRMVEETFRTNQVFKYPEEYDIYNEAVEQSLKKNFGRGQTEKGEFAWKIPDFKEEASKLENFKQRDIYQKREYAARMREIVADEEALEAFLVQKAHEYHNYMAERAKAAKVQAMGVSGEDEAGFQKQTLRDTLAKYYQEMLQKHGDLAKQRFPHISYGQDPNSKTFKKSFPLSFKRYFFKLVKSIIVGGRGKKKLLSKPLSLTLTVGAKEPKLEDGFASKTQNIRLQRVRFGQQLRALKAHKPQTWRTRVFKRQDLKKRLEKVFMQYSEVENCTFEPEAGSLHPNWRNIAKISKEERFRADTVPGEYFNRMGDNFCKSNPALYKKGKFKKAMTNWRSGKYQEVLNILCEGFDLTKLFMHYRAHQFKIWNDFRMEEKKEEKLKNEKSKAKPDDKQILNKKKEEVHKGGINQSDELDPDQIQSIRDVFDKYDQKKEDPVTKKIQNLDQMKYKDLDEAMRACGITPQPVEISEYGKKMDVEGKKYISFEDFLKLMTKKLKDSESQKDLIKAFKILDIDKSGSIDTAEFIEIFTNLHESFSKEEIEKMVKLADTNKDGSISQEEFIDLMHHKREKFKGEDILSQLKQQLKRYIHKQELKRQFKLLPIHVVEMLDYVKDKVEQENKLHPEKKLVYIEDFQSAQLLSIYDDCWGLFESIIAQKEEAAKKKIKSTQQQLELEKTYKILREQIEEGGDEANIADEEGGEKDFRKVFKTIMCPLKLDCPKVKMLRWPSSSIKSHTKFGKDCPYAHHPMELQFQQTLEMRIGANKKTLKELGKGLQERPKVFKFTGDLYDCQGCGAKCNLCAYKRMAQDVIDKTAAKLLNKTSVDKDQIMERKQENDKQRDLFAKKFGILKKASVLMFYGRVNDAFDEIAKAADIIKKQYETQKEQELNLQKRWQFKLGLNEGFELPRPVEKIRPEDVTDEFLKSIDAGSANIATLKLYIQNVCPLIRSQYNRDTFLNGLITDLYYQCEDQLLKKKQNIDTIAKNVEKLNEIQEILEGLGSDIENPPDDLEDNEGNPIKLPKKKRTMCENVQKKKLYKEEGIEMKTDSKYYVDRKYTKTVDLDLETQTIKCTVCKAGKNCKHAHNAIELDLAPLSSKIKNLQVVVKSEKHKLLNDKPLEPWRPAARNFENKVEEPQKIVKGEEEEGDDKKVKRKGILERENVFRKPWDKE